MTSLERTMRFSSKSPRAGGVLIGDSAGRDSVVFGVEALVERKGILVKCLGDFKIDIRGPVNDG